MALHRRRRSLIRCYSSRAAVVSLTSLPFSPRSASRPSKVFALRPTSGLFGLFTTLVRLECNSHTCASALTFRCSLADQAQWIDLTLDDCRARADRAGLNLALDIYVTRADGEGSGRSTPQGSNTPSVSDSDVDEKTSLPSALSTHLGRAIVHRGRPKVEDQIREAITNSTGRTCIVGEYAAGVSASSADYPT